jgi:pyruvate carboxylase subunit B
VKYIVDVDGERIEVDLDRDGVRVGGRVVHAHLADVDGTPIQLVHIDNTVHRVAARRGETRGQYTLWMNGFRYEVEALDERARAIQEMTAEHAVPKGPKRIVAPMPGLVTRIHVREGDQVVAGQGIAVIEAMKMENELRASADGVVRQVLVLLGTAVEKGAVLVEF